MLYYMLFNYLQVHPFCLCLAMIV